MIFQTDFTNYRADCENTGRMYVKIKQVLDDLWNKGQGYAVTVRQLFYQMVSQNMIENTDKSYAIVIQACIEARERGVVDWDAIEDRMREIVIPNSFTSVTDALHTLTSIYRHDRREGQEFQIEIWIEKDSVSQILEPVAWEYGLPFLNGRGQFSGSCLKEAAVRWEKDGRDVKVLYFGDHDPYGILSLEASVRKRMTTWLPRLNQTITRVAVPSAMIGLPSRNAYLLDHLPANHIKETEGEKKKSDKSILEQYRRLYGEESWELEALAPSELVRLAEEELAELMGNDGKQAYQEILDREKEDVTRLTAMIKSTRR